MLVMFTVGVLFTYQAAPPVLRAGEVFRGEMAESDPVVETDTILRDYEGIVFRGKTYRVDRAGNELLTIDLRSHFFDAYLVLRDGEGAVILEDDDGLLGTHARVVLAGRAVERPILVQACAPNGAQGAFELSVTSGAPDTVSPSARAESVLEDARSGLAEVESELGANHPRTATSLNTLGLMLTYRGQLEEARPLLQRGLAIRERELGPDHPETAIILNNLAMLLNHLGEYEEARQLYERALAIDETALGPEHPSTAIALLNLSTLLRDQGEYEEARPLFDRALAISEAALGPDHPTTAAALKGLAWLLQDQGRYEEARPLYERALAIQEKVLGQHHPSTATGLNNLAGLLHDQGEYEEAQALYERALAIQEEVLGPDHPDTTTTLSNLAMLLRLRGAFGSARPLFERVLNSTEKELGSEHRFTATSMNNLALLLTDQGNREEAQRLFGRVLSIQEKVLGQDHPSTATTHNNLGSVLCEQGKYDQARLHFDRALAIHESVCGRDHPLTAMSLSNLAHMLGEQTRYEEARPLFERALAIHDRVYGPEHPLTANCLNNLAHLLGRHGLYQEARPLFERALAIQVKVFGSDHPSTATCLSNVAALFEAQGELQDAWDSCLQSLAARRAHLQRARLAQTEHERVLHLRQHYVAVEQLLGLARSLGTPEANRRAYREVLEWKGVVTRELTSLRRLEARFAASERSSVSHLRGIQSGLSRELFRIDGKDPARLRQLRERRDELERVLAGALERVAPRRDPAIEDVGESLPPGSALLDLLVHRVPAARTEPGNELELRVSAWILRTGETTPLRVDLGGAAELSDTTSAFLEELTAVTPRGLTEIGVVKRQTGPKTPKRRWYDAALKLRESLWEPLVEHLDGVERLFVSPDRFLGRVPFDVLPDGEGGFLIERYSFVYLQDATHLVEISERSASRTDPDLLLVGGVDYGGRDASPQEVVEVASPAFAADTAAMVRGSIGAHWTTLEGTLAETRGILRFHEETFGPGSSRLSLRGPECTEERLKAELPHHATVHLATHGFFFPEGVGCVSDHAEEFIRTRATVDVGEATVLAGALPGLLSGLVLAGANLPTPEDRDDGLLTAEEVGWLHLPDCDLVVLSACDTSLGTDRAGEGMVSLRRAFHIAGAETVVSTFWKVEDKAASVIMQKFYRNLWVEGLSRGEALREAQLSVMRQSRERGADGAPESWGAFAVSGDWR